MVGLRGPGIGLVPLDEIVGRPKNVPLDSDTIATARELGICLGD
jgi:ATP-dependent phosphofructokinase / diphosphate-dependent phosphofructokinase